MTTLNDTDRPILEIIDKTTEQARKIKDTETKISIMTNMENCRNLVLQSIERNQGLASMCLVETSDVETKVLNPYSQRDNDKFNDSK